MHVPWLAVTLKFKVMMLQIRKTVAHICFPRRHCLRPERLRPALEPNLSGNRMKLRVNYQLRPHAAGSQLRACKVKVVAFLEQVVGELISRSHPDAIRSALLADDVNSGYFTLFAAIFGVGRNHQGLEWPSEHGSVALVEPLRLNPNLTRRRTTALHTPLKHPHAVCNSLGGLLNMPGMHSLSILGTS